ncbi:hypothetical protein C3477_15305, partial [Mycobacterium kansasii]
ICYPGGCPPSAVSASLLIKQARKLGKFFYVPTGTVYTSTRRFDTTGYWRLYFQWASFEILPRQLQKRRRYKVVR